MDYEKISKEYIPKPHIKTLLIGEAPPPNRRTYFYLKPDDYKPNRAIEDDRSLPSTIFNHYFGRRPADSFEYEKFLKCLKKRGIFLIDIINEPLKIRAKKGLIEENLEILLSPINLKKLQERIDKLTKNNSKVIFLLPRYNYLKRLKELFPNASFIGWKCFRLDIREAKDCI